MERSGGGFSQPLSHSFSLPSLVEGSEPISEAEEFVEMKSLQNQGDKSLETQNYREAIRYYNEALEIDEQNANVLLARAVALIEMGDYIGAHRDTEILINQDNENYRAYKVQGQALRYLQQYKEALNSFLVSLELDPDNADELTDMIAEVAGKFCNISAEQMDALREMDSYKKMSEVGVYLFQSKKFKVCIKILDAAQKFQTNQKGITMRILLTSANAHSALKHIDKAIQLYQECLTTAISTHDQVYQTKALVNIATLYLENHDTHQAIIHYEKLLHLEMELIAESGSEDSLPDFWTKELQCGLHLNLSIAYKAIGDMQSAIRHAKRYVYYIEKYNFQGKLKAESYHNTGMLNEILGNYKEAINNYNKYLEECKRNGDRKGMAQAYGCLGSVYAALRNWTLSISYHEQYVKMASRFDDSRMKLISNEMLGDSLMLKGDYEEAVLSYEEMINSCIRTDYHTKAMGMCKLGHAYRALKKHQYSLHFYEQAADLGEDFDYPEIETLCHYNMACINQQSTQLLELEKALKYFQQLIPYYEAKIREHRAEDSHCPAEYLTQLCECYDGIQTVLVKVGNKEECLQFAEAYRKRTLTQTHNYQASALTSQSHTAPWDMWTVDRISRVVAQQNSTVMYYSVLTEYLLLWLIQPGQGLVRFYSKKTSPDEPMTEMIESLIREVKSGCDWKKLQTDCESRALPLRNSDLEFTRKQNLVLNKTAEKKDAEEETTKLEEEKKPEKSAERRLYDLLFSPVEDILSKLPKESSVTIIPDKCLHHCPFNVLQDFLNRYAYQRFHITYLPSILLLDKVISNELTRLRAVDDLEFDRKQHKKGGIFQFARTSGKSLRNTSPTSSVFSINPKRMSYPRLLSRPVTKPMIPPTPGVLPKQETMYEDEIRAHSHGKNPRSARGLKPILESRGSSTQTSPRTPSTPGPEGRVMNLNTFTTLTTLTSTGTDITSSHNCIPPFKQVSCQDRCIVFANPKLPESVMLHGKGWRPGLEDMVSAKREALNVASLLDVSPLLGPEANKEKFVKEIASASVVHIATYGCWEEGLLAFSPSPSEVNSVIPTEESYLVTANDILGLRLTAQLVVLSTGYSPFRQTDISTGYLLPSAFIAAGAQCVLVCMWPLPNVAMEKFFNTFYLALQQGSLVTQAVCTALKCLREDDRFKSPLYWSAFTVIGKDVEINLGDIRHAMLDQTLDKSEAEVEEATGKEFLNPKPAVPPVKKKEENLRLLQIQLCTILRYNNKEPNVLPELIELLDSALKRLHTDENNKQTSILSDDVMNGAGALELLKLLGFHFQAKGTSLSNPYVVYPHWNRDELLVPTYDALRAMLELKANKSLVQAICGVLPITQDNISLIIDLFSVTKHAPEIQLKVSDLSVRPLWFNMTLKNLLVATGFHQIGMLLNFNRVPENRQLFMALFQFMLSVSQSKSQVLFYRLDVNLLGTATATTSKATALDIPEFSRLPSLAPLILPRHQLRMSTPWLSTTERQTEMEEKIRLARSRSDLDENFKEYLERAKTWHQMTVVAQANETLDEYGQPIVVPQKVKVKSGASASMERVPVDQKVVLLNPEVDQRRDYAHFVYQQRIANIDLRHRNEVLNLYLPYVNSL